MLKPLPIPISLWTNVILDFIIGLSPSNGYNIVLMVIDQLTKKGHYNLCTIDKSNTTAKATTYLLLNNVLKFYDFPLSLTLD